MIVTPDDRRGERIMRKNMLIWISRFMACIFVTTAIFSGLEISALAGNLQRKLREQRL